MSRTCLHELLQAGVEAGASDWHIRQDERIFVRIDGQICEMENVRLDAEMIQKAMQELCSEKVLAKYEEDGDADFAHTEDDVGRFRVNMHRQRGQPSFTFRHIKAKLPPMEDLGLPPVIKRISGAERGIIMVTGTTGSGKSTTLAAMMQYMNENFGRHIITIEDPIEFHFEDGNSFFEQREVGSDTSSFDSALIHALRQDPDVIVVGEMRRRESFDTALTAADTGHLVMSTLHTSSASQSIQRILDFYEEEERRQIRMALAANLHAIISQRLVPKASGAGVVPAVEVMLNTPMVRKLIEQDRIEKLAPAIEAGERDGMVSFNQCLLKLVNKGLITEEEALIRSTNPEQLQMNLKGIFLGASNAIVG
ncbi:MAG: PilT/PilU family type 4a pilus ATPase [Kiritimatiellaeota bacterium]|nr:PilT/PilU family type 4a pilus ATPase [Kiritimatiellota bacterium]